MYLEQSYLADNGTKVIYKYKPSKYDFNQVLFVFSGFGQDVPPHYNFVNSLNHYPGHIVWISDDFEGFFAYYMCINLDFRVADAVGEFIKEKAIELKVPWENITLLGGSKGGSAALYHGLRWSIKNIIATVPQLKIGSYLVDDQPFTQKTARHMMGDTYSQLQIHRLDKVLIELLKKDTALDKNIYLLTSEYDEHYHRYLVDYLDDFKKYHNFNLMKTYSAFVGQHKQVTEHHLTWILGILYCLASECTPSFASQESCFFGSQPVKNLLATCEPYVDLQQFAYEGGRLFISGVGILRGVPCPTYDDIHYLLIFESNKNRIKKILAIGHNTDLSRKLFDGNLVNYDKGIFTTFKYAGLEIDDIPVGEYQLRLQIKTASKTVICPIGSTKLFTQNVDRYSLECNGKESLLIVKSG